MRLSLAGATLGALVATLVLAGVAAIAPTWGGWPWGDIHHQFALYGTVLPGLFWLTGAIADPHLAQPLRRGADKAGLGLAGGALFALGGPFLFGGWAGFGGALLLAFAAAVHFLSLKEALPRASVVDVARDPLTKGDDACLLLLRFASFFLLAGLALRAVAAFPPLWTVHGLADLPLAADHVLLVGYGLPTLYGLSHLIVPRLSGVPAIAAGAVKGELHSTMLGVVLLAAGFLLRPAWPGGTGLVIAGGLFAFFGAFVFMGVLGANIMKNKSRTQRVTPAFAYIPWTFAGVLWLVCGVLLGIFLNDVQPLFAAKLAGLRAAHAHLVLFGGATQLALGFAARRLAPTPVPFAKHKLAFWLLNLALGACIAGPLLDRPLWTLSASPLALLGLAAWFFPLRRHARAVAG